MKTYNLKYIYSFVNIVDVSVRSSEKTDSEFFSYDLNKFIETSIKFNKLTLLHLFIAQKLFEYYNEYIHFESDILCDDDDWLNDFESLFNDYEIRIELFTEKYPNPDAIDDLDKKLEEWFEKNEKIFYKLFYKIADDVFYILFANRDFLKVFNTLVSKEIQNIKIPKSLLSEKNKIKRIEIPVWVKKAVFLRDKGRCIKCSKDLTGLLSTDTNLHYDHIVPLNLFGVNDPTNIQLLCSECNLKKSGNVIETSSIYSPWWK